MPNQRPAVIAATNTANVSEPTAGCGAVAVDDRDAEPVVAGALGERHGEHEQPDEQRPRLGPGLQRVARRPGVRRGVLVRDRGQEAAHARRHGDGDDHRDGGEVGGRRRRAGRPWPSPSSAPATVPRLNPAWKRGMIERPEPLLDRGALDVHGDVPGAVAEPDEEQPDDDRRHAVWWPTRDGHEADGQQHRHQRGWCAPRRGG